MFDFSDFCGGAATRPVEFLGLTEEATSQLLEQEFGLSKTLLEKYPDIFKRGGSPNAMAKCLILFESFGRRCSYHAIAATLEVNHDTVYQHMVTIRHHVKAAFGLNIEHNSDQVYLVSNQTLAEKAERLQSHLSKVTRAMENLASDVNSIKQSGQTPVLPGTAGYLLAGYEQAKQLEAANAA